jgi:phosphatidylglycerol:prolipoprotein diacylglycerol transferase
MLHISKVSFPGLGIGEFDVNSVAFTIPGINRPIMWYAILITFGMICCIIYTLIQARKIGITFDDVIDFALFTIPIGVIGARLYYVIFDPNPHYDSFIDVIAIWEGGLAIYGGVIGAVAAIFIFCKISKLPAGPLLDVGGLGLLIGQMIGRWGNFINREAHGGITDSFLKMGLENEAGKILYYHPTFFYESLWNLIGFVMLHFYSKRRKFDGEVFAFYVAWYGLGRAWIEGLRTDSLYLFDTGIRVSQLLAIVSFVGAVSYVFYVRRVKSPSSDKLYVNRNVVAAEENTEAIRENQ